MAEYLPVMLSIDHPYPELEEWTAKRFELLNDKPVKIVRREDLPEEALVGYPHYGKAWIWDILPAGVERILFFDYDCIPMRALPEMPDVKFAAVPDAQWFVDKMRAMYPHFAKTRYVFNSGFWMAHRDTRQCFNQLKTYQITVGHASPFGTYDQAPMNNLIQSLFEVHWLPGNVHCLAHTHYTEALDARMLHFPGLPRQARWAVIGLLRNLIGMRVLVE